MGKFETMNRVAKAMMLLVLFATCVLAQSIAGVKIGSPQIVVDSLKLRVLDREKQGSLTRIKYALANGNEISITLDHFK
jgi:hypothetical protein